MTVRQAYDLLQAANPTQSELLNCLEDLAKEYGYIQAMKKAKYRVDDEKTILAEIQNLIEQVKQKIK